MFAIHKPGSLLAACLKSTTVPARLWGRNSHVLASASIIPALHVARRRSIDLRTVRGLGACRANKPVNIILNPVLAQGTSGPVSRKTALPCNFSPEQLLFP